MVPESCRSSVAQLAYDKNIPQQEESGAAAKAAEKGKRVGAQRMKVRLLNI